VYKPKEKLSEDYLGLQAAVVSTLLRPEFAQWEATAGDLQKFSRMLYISLQRRGITLSNPNKTKTHDKQECNHQ